MYTADANVIGEYVLLTKLKLYANIDKIKKYFEGFGRV